MFAARWDVPVYFVPLCMCPSACSLCGRHYVSELSISLCVCVSVRAWM